MHVEHALLELVRHVFAAGGSVSYGGDLRESGYTQSLIELVRSYPNAERPGPEQLIVHRPWASRDLPISIIASLKNVATVEVHKAPPGAPSSTEDTPDSDSSQFWRAEALSEMRKRIASEVDGAVLLGGRVSGFSGFFPGIVEEADAALTAGNGLFVVGGFGGAASLVAQALTGSRPQELLFEHQIVVTPELRTLADGRTDLEAAYGELSSHFEAVGLAGLGNGLSQSDNERLVTTIDVDEVVGLVMRGLRALVSDNSGKDAQ